MASHPSNPSNQGPEFRVGQLRALVASVEEGSLSGGARRLGMAQPTLTRAIQQLELSLGVPILARGPGGLELTEMGRVLLPHARRLVRAHENAQEAAAQLAGARTGTVNVAASALARMLLLPAAAHSLWAQFPDIHLSVVEAAYPHVLDQFEARSIDFAMCPIPMNDIPPQFEAYSLLEARLVVTVRAGHPMKECTSLVQLADQEWIAAGPPFGQGLSEAFRANGLAPPVLRTHCESLEHALSLVARSDMMTLAPRAVAAGSVSSARLHQLDLHETLPEVSIGLLIPRQRALTPAAQQLIDALMADAAGSLEQGRP